MSTSFAAVFNEARLAECNSLLRAIPSDEYELLTPQLELVDLPQHTVLFEPGTEITHVYFPQTGLISIVAAPEEGGVEASAVANRGFFGLPVMFGAPVSIHRSVVQIPGRSKRVTADAFLESLPEMPAFHALLLRFAHVQLEIARRNVACNRLHDIEERCARWLLQTSDQIQSDRVDLTHEFVAKMLGVRRAGVTVAAEALRRAGMIDYRRGRVTILDRALLKSVACSCYDAVHSLVEPQLGAAR